MPSAGGVACGHIENDVDLLYFSGHEPNMSVREDGLAVLPFERAMPFCTKSLSARRCEPAFQLYVNDLMSVISKKLKWIMGTKM